MQLVALDEVCISCIANLPVTHVLPDGGDWSAMLTPQAGHCAVE